MDRRAAGEGACRPHDAYRAVRRLFELDYGIAKSQRPVDGRLLLNAFFSSDFVFPDFDADDAREAGEIRAYLEGLGAPIGHYDVIAARHVT